jgi:uncharacterized protein (TIGR00730 family)
VIITVYAASSSQCAPHYHEAARELGATIARAGHHLVYGGGAVGSMGAVAAGALAEGGEVTGVLPRFMDELEWGHRSLSTMVVVESMHERKLKMLELADAVVALPGGCGTLEELFEAITWKRLGLITAPIVMLNTHDFYTPVVALLQQAIDERFMNPEHAAMWSIAASPGEVLAVINAAPKWSSAAREFAVVRA